MAKQVNSALIGKAIIARIDKAGGTRDAFGGDVIKLLDD